MALATEDISSIRVSKSKTKPLLDEERHGRETDDDLIQRLIKEVREYRRRCG
ncbi:MAG: hypothetical protein Q8R70_04975 [Methanoregula sp.]|nr:hypothetical protein [Methanoregula sp.]